MSYHDSVLLQKISAHICQSIIAIQQQQPELLIAKYRTINWQIPTNKSALSTKFKAILSQTQTWDELLQKLQSSLKAILVPAAFDSQLLSDLISSIQQLNSENPESNSLHFPQRQSIGIAVLLLDAENLQLNTHTEKFLTTICNCPLQVKIAFANWSNRGKLDVELHERGYDLIHVPAGRDNADGKMIAIGSSIHERYPNVQEVFVCSSDKVMTNLCNKLQQNGILVYQVSQQGENIKLFNSSTSEIINHSLKPLPEIPSVEQFISQIKGLIKLQQKQTASYWIKLSILSKIFKSKYQLTISQIVAHHFPGKKARDVFINYPSEFVVHQIDEKSELYVTVFEHHQTKLDNSQENSQTQLILSTINSPPELEQAIKNILTDLITADHQNSVDISILGSKFYQQYGKPITEQIKQLQIGGSLVKFLHSCNSLKIQQVGKKWEVSIKN
ncbi:NYN domain-containing protein [Anabaena sp. UHCC 0204]|uniref:NYN domain-containing protein n=1 Tax=Anabaena sp. UHCC 0204 TaxID=2590009 RepID=UPI0014460575|nr:NYN domain-containing protein [Anabaena sp. UHCC 0204]MTJ10961.1 NYN domain-containing protein [Anabaena sp. UHCC 0204]